MAKRKELTSEQLKEIEMLKASNQMLSKSKEEALQRGKTAAVKQIERAERENVEHIKSIDPTADVSVSTVLESFNSPKKKEIKQDNLFSDNALDVFAFEEKVSAPVVEDIKKAEIVNAEKNTNPMADIVPNENNDIDTSFFDSFGSDAQFDIIPLPSNGQCYASKIDRVPVSYLTAYDENIITSPNLYKDGLVIDYLLKNKVQTDAINVDDLVSGDADAIILYLRATSYGADFPIVINDPETGEQIETTVDLTKLKPREFKLIGDENGNFDFETPLRHDKIKFRYLTRKQEKQLRKITELESIGTKALMLEGEKDTLINAINNDIYVSEQDKISIKNATKSIDNWVKKLREINSSHFTNLITNNLLLQIVSVNGNSDREYIKKWVMKMPARDSLMLRRYINDNRPGIDFNIEVERPESLGGGSFTTFLNWDDSVFINISDV